MEFEDDALFQGEAEPRADFSVSVSPPGLIPATNTPLESIVPGPDDGSPAAASFRTRLELSRAMCLSVSIRTFPLLTGVLKGVLPKDS